MNTIMIGLISAIIIVAVVSGIGLFVFFSKSNDEHIKNH